jgi:hypothetical protein
MQRCGPRRGLAVAAILLLALTGAVPARAQGDAVAVPAGAPVVAGPTASGTAAVAFVRDGQLCMAYVQASRPASGPQEGFCQAMPVLRPFGRQPIGERTGPGGVYQEIGVTGGSAAFLAYKLGGQTIAQTATQPSPLPGAAAALRFYALETAADATSDELALLDAFGAVQRAHPANQADSEGPAPSQPPVRPGPIVAQGRRGHTRWTLRTRIDHPLGPTPLLPERRIAQACVTFSAGTGTALSQIAEQCATERDVAEPLLLGLAGTCALPGVNLTFLARAPVRRVVVVLGDGRRRSVVLHAVPGAPAGERAGVFLLASGMAVRRVIGTGAGGRPVERHELGFAPVPYGDACEPLGGSLSAEPVQRGLPATLLGAGPHTPHVSTDGAALCLAIDRVPRPPAGCRPPPLEPEDAEVFAEPTATGRYVAGFVPRDVALARLALDGGGTRDVRPVPVDGPYASTVALVAADVPGTRRVIGYTLLDAAGRAVQTAEHGPESPAVGHQTVALPHPGRGLAPLIVGLAPQGRSAAITCLGLADLRDPSFCLPAAPGAIVTIAHCAPRQLVLVGLLAHSDQRLAVRTAAGAEIQGRTVALPAALRVPTPDGFTRTPRAVALAVVPAHAAPRELVVHGPAAHRVKLALPSAAAQCGYLHFFDG